MEGVHLDFETRSETDLMTEGVYNYSLDESTDIICMCWAYGDGQINTWIPGDRFPPLLEVYIENGDFFYAHNAAFERLLWNIMVEKYGAPTIPLEQWRCTAFMASTSNMPPSLDKCARALGSTQKKDPRGRELIKLLSLPMADGSFCEDPALLQEMYDYCVQDVRVERDICKRLRMPTDVEWEDYYVNERINDRGVLVDMRLVHGAVEYAAEEEAELVAEIERVTKGAVTKARGEKLKTWIMERLTDDQAALTIKHRDGEKKISLDRFNRARLLDLQDLDPDVQRVLECSDFAQKSSVGKFRAMANLADLDDGRVRGAFMANGASQSGRYSSRGLQVHNFPRATMGEQSEEVRADLIDNIMAEDIVDYYELPMLVLLSRSLRAALIPAPGKRFVVSDWSAIEGRVGPWLADHEWGELKLNHYRGGIDTYKVAAQAIYHTSYDEVSKDQRQVGKVAELALGFGGGVGAFTAMARGYGITGLSEGDIEHIRDAWRQANPWARMMWDGCEGAAMAAIQNPGDIFKIGRLLYFAVEDVIAGGTTLFCQLPDGRLLTYPDVRIEHRIKWGKDHYVISALRAAWTPKVNEKEWPRADLWGGLLFENVVQGTAASLLRCALRRCSEADLDVVLHIHDEIVVESRNPNVDRGVLGSIMNVGPEWAEGLPLSADVEIMKRFGK